MATQAVPLAESAILRSYSLKTPRSRALHEQAKTLLPNGVTHVGRYLEPHPVYIDRAAASHKWDVDGNEYVDYFGGHGSLILGHSHPAVVSAVTEQIQRGTHYGASHSLEVAWAGLIHEMIPSAERIRFTASGTEATHLAIRLARAFSGKSKVVRFAGHFHGWHDHVSFQRGGAAGIPSSVVDDTLIVDPHDTAAVEQLLATRDDIALVMLEPTGATFGHVPADGEVLRQLREITSKHNVLLMFDEVVTGFRCSPGGAQQLYGVTPDLTSLAKIVAGGYPGAAVVGRADIIGLLDYQHEGSRITPPRIPHQGTYNANPVGAAAGIATLTLIRDTDVVGTANRTAAQIREGMNAVLKKRGLPWCVYGAFSDFHIFPGRATVEEIYAGRIPWQQLKGGVSTELVHKMRTGFLLHGVDIAGWPGGVVSAAHTSDDVAKTVNAFDATLGLLAEEGDL